MDYYIPYGSSNNNNTRTTRETGSSSSSSPSASSKPNNKRNNNNNKKKISNNNNKKGVMKLSTDPQSVAARERRHRISDRFKILQSMVPGGTKMDTVSMLEEAIHYVKFLKTQIWLHQTMMIMNNNYSNNFVDTHQFSPQTMLLPHHCYTNNNNNNNFSASEQSNVPLFQQNPSSVELESALLLPEFASAQGTPFGGDAGFNN